MIKKIIFIVILLVILVGGYFVLRGGNDGTGGTQEIVDEAQETIAFQAEVGNNLVSETDDINLGDVVE